MMFFRRKVRRVYPTKEKRRGEEKELYIKWINPWKELSRDGEKYWTEFWFSKGEFSIPLIQFFFFLYLHICVCSSFTLNIFYKYSRTSSGYLTCMPCVCLEINDRHSSTIWLVFFNCNILLIIWDSYDTSRLVAIACNNEDADDILPVVEEDAEEGEKFEEIEIFSFFERIIYDFKVEYSSITFLMNFQINLRLGSALSK